MELRVLQYFLAVVREKNITRAAEALHVTQPTLSRQIAQLEEELGAPLFIRGKTLTLTDAGMLLLRRAEEVDTLMRKIEGDFAEQSDVGGVIAIGSGGQIAARALPDILRGFREKYPRVSYRLYTNNAEHVKEKLEHGTLDFGFLLEPVDVSKFDYIRMKRRERWGLLLPAAHPLARKETIQKADLYALPLMLSNRPAIQKELEEWLGAPLSELNLFATYNIVTNAAILAESGAAAALTIEGAVALMDNRRVVFRPLEPELSMSSVLVWKKFQTHFGAAAKFTEYFKSMLEMYEKA